MRLLRRSRRLNILAMSIAVTLAVLGEALLELLLHVLGGKAASSVVWLTGTILVVLVVTLGILQRVSRNVDDLANGSITRMDRLAADMQRNIGNLADRVGLAVQYYPLDPGPESAHRHQQGTQLYGACAQLIDSVSEQPGSWIVAVNSFVEIWGQAGDDQVEAASRRYLATFDKKIGRVQYTRIIQLSPNDLEQLPGKSIAKLIAPNYLEHYQKIVKASETSRGDKLAYVEAVLAKYPISFVLVHDATDSESGGSLIFQMNEHVHNGRPDSVQLTGVWIIKDPNGIMTRTFKDWFVELDRDPARHRLKSGNLDPNGELIA
jgi:hypothetical protein